MLKFAITSLVPIECQNNKEQTEHTENYNENLDTAKFYYNTAFAAVRGVQARPVRASKTASCKTHYTRTPLTRQPVGGNPPVAVAATRHTGDTAKLFDIPLCAACGLLQPPRSLEMEQRTIKQIALIADFEQKAQDLVHTMLMLCEQYIAAEPEPSPKTLAAAAAALAVQEAVKTFLAVERSL